MITLQEVVTAAGGQCDFAGNPDFTGINTDTRTIKNGELFIALKGETFDGHAYAEKRRKTARRASLHPGR